MITNISPVGGAMRMNQLRGYTAPSAPLTGHGGEKFDKVTLSAHEGEDPYKMELQGKLSQEVRTATTTGALASLREQVRAGEYQVDANSIAKKILLLGEV